MGTALIVMDVRKRIYRTREVYGKTAGGIRTIISAGRLDSENNFCRPAGFGKFGRPAAFGNIFGRIFRSRAQIKVHVMTINSVQFSSKSELSSGTLGRVKVYRFGTSPLMHLTLLENPE